MKPRISLLFALAMLVTCNTGNTQCELDDFWVRTSTLAQMSVDVKGGRILVGAPEDDSGIGSGSAFVFVLDDGQWVEEAQLSAEDLDTNDLFGSSVALGSEFALVGASADDDTLNNSGSVYVFRRNGSSWMLESKFQAESPRDNGRFGERMALHDDHLIVASRQAQRVYYFEWTGTSWQELQELGGDNGFGWTIAQNGRWFASFTRTGVATYKIEGRQLVWAGQILAPNSDECGNDCDFGWGLALDHNTLAITQRHRVHIYENHSGNWNYMSSPLSRQWAEFEYLAFQDGVLAVGDTTSPRPVDILQTDRSTLPDEASVAQQPWRHIAHVLGSEDGALRNTFAMDDEHLVVETAQSRTMTVWTLGQSTCCRTHFGRFGAGTHGAGGFIPSLSGIDGECVALSSRLIIEFGLGGAPCLLMVGTRRAETPFANGFLFVETPWYRLDLTLDGLAGWPGAGSTELPLPHVREFLNRSIFLQAAVLDADADDGVALSNGLKLRIKAN